MKSIDLASKRLKSEEGLSWKDQVAKKVILSKLKDLAVGELIVEDSGEVWNFGKKTTAADGIENTLVARIHIEHPSAYRRILTGGTIGAGESYMLGEWTSTDLTSVVRVMVLNQQHLRNMDSSWSWLSKRVASLADLMRVNSMSGSKRNIAAHYDLSNELFQLFLDPTMMYSSAIYPSKDASLEEASLYKLDHICKRLALSDNDHLLEIGTGWGGLAIHAAKNYGCKVTTTTISDEQFQYASERVEALGLTDKITLLKKDYRELTGSFDKLVSVEMIEAVGHKFYKNFFSKCNSLLKENGLMLMQAITTGDDRFENEKNQTDFIRTYIFPGGCLPSNRIISEMTAKLTDMHWVSLDDITLDYARTLADWRDRFFERIDEVKNLGFDDMFIRMWDFYLSYCEGGFQERTINTSQFLFAKPGARSLPLVK